MSNPAEMYKEDIAYAQSLHDEHPEGYVDWSVKGLEIVRLRLLSDPGLPWWDVSYCYGRLNGKLVNVQLPWSQLPKRNFKGYMIDYAKKKGLFVKVSYKTSHVSLERRN